MATMACTGINTKHSYLVNVSHMNTIIYEMTQSENYLNNLATVAITHGSHLFSKCHITSE